MDWEEHATELACQPASAWENPWFTATWDPLEELGSH